MKDCPFAGGYTHLGEFVLREKICRMLHVFGGRRRNWCKRAHRNISCDFFSLGAAICYVHTSVLHTSVLLAETDANERVEIFPVIFLPASCTASDGIATLSDNGRVLPNTSGLLKHRINDIYVGDQTFWFALLFLIIFGFQQLSLMIRQTLKSLIIPS